MQHISTYNTFLGSRKNAPKNCVLSCLKLRPCNRLTLAIPGSLLSRSRLGSFCRNSTARRNWERCASSNRSFLAWNRNSPTHDAPLKQPWHGRDDGTRRLVLGSHFVLETNTLSMVLFSGNTQNKWNGILQQGMLGNSRKLKFHGSEDQTKQRA